MSIEKKEEFKNPIDPEKIVENPGLVSFPHHVGSALIKPVDRGKVKSNGLAAMEKQTHQQLKQIYDQMQLLATQAKSIQDRVEISERIYQAEMNFQPLMSHQYFLYERTDGTDVLSMISESEWGRSMPFSRYLAAVTLLPDHTWEINENKLDQS